VHTQKLAIDSLHFYASVASFFVVIAPKAMHEGKQEIVDESTYNNRGWWYDGPPNTAQASSDPPHSVYL
jgi:hypothetical protein